MIYGPNLFFFLALIGIFIAIAVNSRRGTRIELSSEEVRQKIVQIELPEDLRSTTIPRNVTLSRRGVTLLFMFGIFAVLYSAISVYSFFSLRAEHRKYDLLTQSGVTTDGHWTGPCQRLTGKNQHGYSCWYSFAANGQNFQGQAKMDRIQTQGTLTQVVYLPFDPSVHRAREGRPPAPLWISGLLLILIPAFLTVPYFTLIKQKGLLTTGTPTIGVVVARNSGRNQQAQFAFIDRYGQIHHGKSIVQRGSSGPAMGASIPILYDEQNPKKCEIYPMAMFQLASRKTVG